MAGTRSSRGVSPCYSPFLSNAWCVPWKKSVRDCCALRPRWRAAPDLSGVDDSGDFRVLPLESLVRMKLTSFRRKDQVHLLDLIGVGLIDESWLPRLPVELAARLKELIDHPDE